MKKVLAFILCILTLTFAATGCKPKVDPYEGLYGTYNMVVDGTEVYSGGKQIIDGVPHDVAVYLEGIKTQAGKTIEITKEKIKFSGGSIEAEFDYWRTGPYLFVDRDIAESLGFDFFLGQVGIETFRVDGEIVYQLCAREYPVINEVKYSIHFFYVAN